MWRVCDLQCTDLICYFNMLLWWLFFHLRFLSFVLQPLVVKPAPSDHLFYYSLFTPCFFLLTTFCMFLFYVHCGKTKLYICILFYTWPDWVCMDFIIKSLCNVSCAIFVTFVTSWYLVVLFKLVRAMYFLLFGV